MKIFKMILSVIVCVLFIPCTYLNIYAETENELQEEINNINTILDDSSGGILSENNISVESPEKIMDYTPRSIFAILTDKISENITAPLRLFVLLFSLVLLSAVTEHMYIGNNVSGIVAVLVSIAVLKDPVSECFTKASVSIQDGSLFMLGYVPVMSGAMIATGNVTSAGSYNLIVLTVCEVAVQLASNIFVPVLSVCFSLSIVDAVNPGMNLGGMITGLKKTVTVVMGFIMTIFVGLLSIQSIVGGSVDSLSVKTGKYIVSNLVPVIGGAISDAYATVYGSLGVLKNGIGTVGIIILITVMLPPVVMLFMYRMSVYLAMISADIFSCTYLKKLFADIESVLGIVISIVLMFSVMLIICTVIVMKMGAVL